MAERWGIGLMAAIGAAAGGLSAAAASLLDGGDALPAGLAVGVAGGAVVSAALAWAVREQRDLPGLSTPSPLPVALPQPAPALETGPPANLEPLVRAIGERFSALADRQLEAIQQLGDTRPDLRGSAPLAEADRLARRSARAATTLLVLADPDELAPPGRDRTIAEVLDAALADSAHRDRIDVGSLHDETVRGLFVGDVAHLLAELIDNAAAASVEPVVVVGRRAADGYVLAVVDEGAGLSAVARAGANEVLHSPPELHSQEPVALGLSVVGRLAARHGISVQLLEGATDGTIAKVRLPARLLEGGEQQQQPSALDRAMEALAPAPSSLPGRWRARSAPRATRPRRPGSAGCTTRPRRAAGAALSGRARALRTPRRRRSRARTPRPRAGARADRPSSVTAARCRTVRATSAGRRPPRTDARPRAGCGRVPDRDASAAGPARPAAGRGSRRRRPAGSTRRGSTPGS